MKIDDLALIVCDVSGEFPWTVGRTVRITGSLDYRIANFGGTKMGSYLCYTATLTHPGPDGFLDDYRYMPRELMPLDPLPERVDAEEVEA